MDKFRHLRAQHEYASKCVFFLLGPYFWEVWSFLFQLCLQHRHRSNLCIQPVDMDNNISVTIRLLTSDKLIKESEMEKFRHLLALRACLLS